jgi:hypothetical protein
VFIRKNSSHAVTNNIQIVRYYCVSVIITVKSSKHLLQLKRNSVTFSNTEHCFQSGKHVGVFAKQSEQFYTQLLTYFPYVDKMSITCIVAYRQEAELGLHIRM